MAQLQSRGISHLDLPSPEYTGPAHGREDRMDFMIDIRAEYYYIYLKKSQYNALVTKNDCIGPLVLHKAPKKGNLKITQ